MAALAAAALGAIDCQDEDVRPRRAPRRSAWSPGLAQRGGMLSQTGYLWTHACKAPPYFDHALSSSARGAHLRGVGSAPLTGSARHPALLCAKIIFQAPP